MLDTDTASTGTARILVKHSIRNQRGKERLQDLVEQLPRISGRK
jgi:hypothetical protein